MQQLESWPTDSLIEYARNPRKNDHAVDRVAAAIREFGFRVPILAKSDKTIVDGHLRLKAAKKLGLEEVAVLLCDDMTDIQLRAFRLSVNRVSEFADWDDEMLRVELDALGEDGFDLELTGFSLDEIADLQIEEVPEGLTDEDAVPEAPGEPVTVYGDVWVLGDHRLKCGDSTSIDAVEKLMDGQKADLLFTDPYYSDDTAPTIAVIDAINVDNLLLMLTMKQIISYINNLKNYKFRFDSVLITKTPSSMLNKNVPYYLHKNIIYLTKGDMSIFSCDNAKGTFSENGYYPSVIEFKKNSHAEHGVEKPVNCIIEILSGFAAKTILDLFGGSGTTLIACEKTNRNALLIELEPKYCDVIINRWQDFTGKEAVLESTGETYNSKVTV